MPSLLDLHGAHPSDAHPSGGGRQSEGTQQRQGARLGDRLRQARDRAFVGRAGETRLFASILADKDGSCSVVYLHGSGGIGKSTLLRRFVDQAAAAGRDVVVIDGRSVEQTPAGFEAAAAGAFGSGTVLFVDSFEKYEASDNDFWETWFWDSFLTRLPADTLVVIASRQPPRVSLQIDPAWSGVLREVVLGELSSVEAHELMAVRGVPTDLHASLYSFAGGHPLALTLAAAAAVRDARRADRWLPYGPVLTTLLDELVGDVPSPAHRHALEICAHVLTTTETLLRVAFGDAAGAMFAWLREQPYIEAGPHGLYPHELVRDLLNADLRWRDPRGWDELHQMLRAFLVEQALQSYGSAVIPSMLAMSYLHRDGEALGRFITWRGQGEVFEDRYDPADREAVLRLAARSADPADIEPIGYWLDRQPGSFVVYRRPGSDRVTGFMAWLKLTGRDVEETTADAVVAAIWDHVERTAAPRPGEHIGIARFIVQAEGPLAPSPQGDLACMRFLASCLHSAGLAWSFVVLPNADFWAPMLEYVDHRRLHDALSSTFAHDWRVTTRDNWFELLGERLRHGPQASLPGHTDAMTLPRPEFETAVRNALRSWHHRSALVDNPLAATALAGHGSPDERVATLRNTLEEAVDTLRESPRLEKLHRVLAATFFHRNTTQEAAAERLGLPFSTYRRHLTTGVELVTDELWRRVLPPVA